jgi:phospholipase/carboxylesterase
MTLHFELIPSRVKDSRQLLVALHGLGDSLEGYRWLPDALRIPSMNYLLVNAPDDYYGGFSWYDIYGNPEPGIRRSRALLVSLLEDLERQGFPASQTTLLGFSQGCLMTIELAARFPKRFAGVVAISGYVHQPEVLVKELSPVAGEQRILFTHGSLDKLIASSEVERQVELLRKAGLHIQWKVFAKEHTIAGEEEIRLIRQFVEEGYPVAPLPAKQ